METIQMKGKIVQIGKDHVQSRIVVRSNGSFIEIPVSDSTVENIQGNILYKDVTIKIEIEA